MEKQKEYSQPKALPFLFLTEMWERFGFYVIQGLLVIYMIHEFDYSDNKSYTILGVFTALAYISPLAGGYVANRFLGYKNAIIWGGLFLILGYALIAMPYAKFLFYPALATIVVGNGLLKPNISSLLGTQYSEKNPKRDSGFTIFYVGINLGAFLAGMSSGYVQKEYGWHICFALNSIGLIIGLLTFSIGTKYLIKPAKEIVVTSKTKLQLFLCCLLTILILTYSFNLKIISDWLLPISGIFLFIGLIILTARQPLETRRKMWVLNVLIVAAVIFWMLFLQMFYSINLYIDRLVDKNLFGIPLTSTVFYASEGVFIILLGPLFAWIWQKLGAKNKNPSPITKYIYGIMFTGLGFLILATSTFFLNDNNLIHPLWIFSAYFLITIGELLISPIGLSAVTLLAPGRLVGLLMGVWFVALGFGGLFSGMIAKFASIPSSVTLVSDKIFIYQQAFLYYAYIAFAVGIILCIGQISIKKILRGSNT